MVAHPAICTHPTALDRDGRLDLAAKLGMSEGGAVRGSGFVGL